MDEKRTPEDRPTPAWPSLTPELKAYVLFVLEERYAYLAQECAAAEARRVLGDEAMKKTLSQLPEAIAVGAAMTYQAHSNAEEQVVEEVLAMVVRSAINELTKGPER
jgi:F0F1-type ATP synthase membrane subunit b/b'